MTPYERALEAVAKAEAEHGRLKSPRTLARVLQARKFADKVFRESFGTDENPTPGPRLIERRFRSAHGRVRW